MSKRQLIIVLGVWLMLLPFLGVPDMVKKVLVLITGILIALIATSMKPKAKPVSQNNMPYVEYKSADIRPKDEARSV